MFDGPDRLLARGDLGVRLLSGLPPDTVLEPEGEDGPAFAERCARLRAGFTAGLRGMDKASPGYLARQFFAQPGRIALDDAAVTARVHAVPLKVLLHLAGRLGRQGPVQWLAERELVVEVGDG
jgi:hypothetical protein